MTRKQFVGVKLPPELVAKLDGLAESIGVGRSEMIRIAIEAGLLAGEQVARSAVDEALTVAPGPGRAFINDEEVTVVDPPTAEAVARGKARAVKAVGKSSGQRQVETMFKGGK